MLVFASVDYRPSGFAGFFAALADRLDGQGGREVTLNDGRRSLELVTAIYEAARNGAVVDLPLGEGHALYEGWGRRAREISADRGRNAPVAASHS